MCIKLIQTYACSHQKTICTTPCPHALETRYQILEDEPTISRSDSTVSSIMSSPRRNEHLRSPPSPLQIRSPPSTPSSPNHVARSISSGQSSPISPPPGYPAHSSPSPTPGLGRSHLPSQTRRSTPLLNARTSSCLSLTDPTSPALPLKPVTIEPNYCPYHFPRHLPQSAQPCIECYMLPEWEHMAGHWMKAYREHHHLGKAENVERESGVEALRRRERRKREREGLLNVFVDGDEGVGRVG